MALAGCGTTAVSSPTSGGPTTQGGLVFQGNFSAPDQQWPTSSNPTSSSSATGDTYTLQLKSPGTFDASPTIAAVQPQDLTNVSVSVSATPANVQGGDTFGVFCRSLEGHSYAFLVGPQSSGQLAWSIQLRQPAGVRQLARGTTSPPGTSPYSVRGDCVGGGADHKPVILALYVAGNLVGRAQDAKLPAPYVGQPGLSIGSARGGTAVDFSNFQVRGASAS
jgi:hypothetical protein